MVVDLAIRSIAELAFIVAFILSLLISLYAFFSFLSQRTPLRLQLTQIEAELELLRPKLPKKRLRVRMIRRTIEPLHQKRQVFSYYYRILQDIIRDFDLRQAEAERKQEETKKEKHEAETGQRKADLFDQQDDNNR